ncbi:MAG: hypothetical protein LKH74_05795 [Levilactobacillus sp.]|uniref:hypothetical protein n=1 Tax=Levilactobacillus sp. TaxID=2767919 RepID=UPI002586C48B|nr:hypothetical protein [Levilactobacillus sp.]MCI1553422.1 hypothetical protein [Levilactobacillus sp.]MCI1597811.1 hypothetical protein [Levilactobacillus sp.]MCI1605581.1 hypothetical protein [Levilactobacillus sp.]
MSRLRRAGIDFSVGTLNFLANIGLMLPYILMLLKYQQTQSETYLIALVAFYISRAASIFYTKRLHLRSSTYLIACLVLGALGSLIFAVTTAVGWLIVGSLLWGYSAATIWPYFLTVKLHLTQLTDFKMKRLYWVIFLGLGIMLGVDLAAGWSYTLTFSALALLYLAALPGGLLLEQFTNDFYRQQAPQRHRLQQGWRWALSLVGFAAIAVLTTLRKTQLNWPNWLLLTIIGVALLVFAIELYTDRNVLPQYKVRLLNRGFTMSLVLLFNSFFAYFYFGTAGMYLVFALYLIGFETGYPVFGKLAHDDSHQALRLSQISLLAGHALLLVPWQGSFVLGLLLITLYIGYDNPTINATLYGAPDIDHDTAIIHKYRFSTYGGLLCQLVMFGLIIAVSASANLSILAFFKPSDASHFWLYTWTLSWPLTLASLGISLGNVLHEPKN